MAKTVEVIGRLAERSGSFRVAKAKRNLAGHLAEYGFAGSFNKHIENVKKRGDSGIRGRLECFQLMENGLSGSS